MTNRFGTFTIFGMILGLILLSPSVIPKLAGQDQDVEREFEALLTEYFIHRNNADFPYFEEFYAPDVVTVHSGKLADGREALIRDVQNFIEGGSQRKTEIENLVLEQHRDIVWVRFTMHNTSIRGSKKQDAHVFTTMAFEKLPSGKWRCFHVCAAPLRIGS